jgi:hypothetical protein
LSDVEPFVSVKVYVATVAGFTTPGDSAAVKLFGAAAAAVARTSTPRQAATNGMRRRLNKKDPF